MIDDAEQSLVFTDGIPLTIVNEHAEQWMAMHSRKALLSADPVHLGVQSDRIGAPEPMSIDAVLAAQTAALRVPAKEYRLRCVTGIGLVARLH
jgi:hypothetical protein